VPEAGGGRPLLSRDGALRGRGREELSLEAQADDGPGGGGPYRLRLRLPRPVDEGRVRAKWKKASRCLHVALPLAAPDS
jgi:hypothetical protein